jgi:hypothetical protein
VKAVAMASPKPRPVRRFEPSGPEGLVVGTDGVMRCLAGCNSAVRPSPQQASPEASSHDTVRGDQAGLNLALRSPDITQECHFIKQVFVHSDVQQDRCAASMLGQRQRALGVLDLVKERGCVGPEFSYRPVPLRPSGGWLPSRD